MATATVQLNVTGNAQQQLARVQKQVDTLGSAFSGLRNMLGGIALGAFATNILRSADAMDDLANATGFTISEINGLGAAFAANGGEAQDAETAITRFANSLDDARNGGAKTQASLAKIGITLNDLRTLNDQDIFRKVIAGLGQMPAGAQRTALAMEILGKNVRAVDFTGVNDSLDQFVAKSAKAEPGIKNAAKLFDNLRAIGRETTNQLFADTTSLSGSLARLTENTELIAVSISRLVNLLAIAGAAFLIFTRALPAVQKLKDAFADFGKIGGLGLFSTQVKQAGKEWNQFVLNFSKGMGIVDPSRTFKWWASLGFAIGALGKSALRLSGLGAIAYGIGEAFKYLTGTINPVAKAFEFIYEVGIVVLARLKGEWESLIASFQYGVSLISGIIPESIKNIFGGALDFASNRLSQFRDSWNNLVNISKEKLGFTFEQPEQVQQPEANTTEAIDANEKLRNSIYDVNKAYALQFQELSNGLDKQYDYLNLSQQEVEILQAQDDIRKRAADSIASLVDIKEGLKEEERDLIPIINQQIESINLQRDVQVQAVAQQIQSIQQLKLEQEKYNHTLEQTKTALSSSESLQALQDQLSLVGQYGQELENNLIRLDVQRELESTLNALALRALELEQQRVQLGEQRYQQEMNNLLALTDAAYRYADARLEAEKKILDAQRATQQNAKLGTEQAIADIQKQFEPYTMAQDAVKQGWGRVSDALDTFVETGKLKFGDLARSILADLAKMILKAMVFKAISGIAGAFGLSIPGLAKGGPAKAGQPYIVGEKGPELFVPQGAGSVVPNNKLNQGVATGAVNAPVTNNYITNNINAIDAKSVAQLFAENRKTLLGSVKMAERETPYMAR